MITVLERFLKYFSESIVLVDHDKPQKISRTGREYQNGIGPFTEDETVDMILEKIPKQDDMEFQRFVPYPNNKRSKCDLMIKTSSEDLYIEVKMMRLFGDNGKPNDNITTHILSPYPQQRSALTDIQKLKESVFDGAKAIVIYGYDYDDYPLQAIIDCFEVLAEDNLEIPGIFYNFNGLIHKVHKRGAVYAWMLKE